MNKIITRFVEHERCVDIEQNFNGIWAVIRCSAQIYTPPPAVNTDPEIIQRRKKARDAKKSKYKDMYPNRIPGSDKYCRYGITQKDYEAIKELQNSKCLICGRSVSLVVDHDHKTGELRGLLCGRCNSGLGMFEDSVPLLNNAIIYLNKDA